MSELYLVAVLALLVGRGGSKCHDLSIELTDAIKSVCAILIMVGHCIIATKNTSLSVFNVGGYCVAIFFFISGWGLYFGIKTKPAYLSTFFHKRIPKVILPFLTAHLIYYFVKSVLGVHILWKDVILGLLGNLNIVDYSWYPVAIVLMYIVFWFTFISKISDDKKIWFLFMLVTVITLIEYVFWGKDKAWWYISNLAFVAGVFLKRLEPRFRSIKTIILLGSLVFGVGYILIPVCGRLFGQYFFGVYIAASNLQSAGLSIVAIFLVCAIGHRASVFTILGKYSYEMYLMHGLFIWMGVRCGIQNTLVLIIFCVVLTIPVSIVAYRINGRIIEYLDTKKNEGIK